MLVERGERRKKKGSEREDDMWDLHVSGPHTFFLLMTNGPAYFFILMPHKPYVNAT